MTATPGAIGSFQVERELGRGGMGVVYLARDSRLGRNVAIKALPEHLADDPDRLARFEREARTLASLNHPNLAGIHGIEEQDGRKYLVLEYVEGETLGELLERGAMPVDEALEVGAQIAAGLEAAHEAGVIHRDLKPGNIKITSDGKVKVLDFGLARAGDAAPSSMFARAMPDSPTMTTPLAPIHSPTIPGVIMGTAGYMSPEQARGKSVDKRSDIFSLGCVLFEMLTGAQPFQGETATDSIGAILHREPHWASLPPETPARVRDLLARCLEKDRKIRQRDIGDVRLELERAATGKDWPGAGGLGRRDGLARRFGWAAAIALVAFAAGAALWSWIGPARSTADSLASPGVMRLSVPVPHKMTQTLFNVYDRPMLTPDGRTLCYAAIDSEGGVQTPRVFRRRIDETTVAAIPGTDHVIAAGLSSNGREVVYMVRPPDRRESPWIARAPIDGSAPPTRLGTIDSASDLFVPRITCLPGGDVLHTYGIEKLQIRHVSVDGASSTGVNVITEIPYDAIFLGPALPDGGAVLVTAVRFSNPFTTDAAVVDLGTGRLTTLCSGGCPVYSRSGHLLVAREATIIAAPFDASKRSLLGPSVAVMSGVRTQEVPSLCVVSISDNGTLAYLPGTEVGKQRRLAWLSGQGEAAQWGDGRRRNLNDELSVSSDGRRIAVVVSSPDYLLEIWGAEIDGSSLRPIAQQKGFDLLSPTLSPDGSMVAYIARPGATGSSLCIVPFDRSQEPRTLLTDPGASGSFAPRAWMPDGSGIIVDRISKGERCLLLVPLDHKPDSTADLQPLFKTESNCYDATFSPDGRLLAYVSTESGGPEVYIRPLEKGDFGAPIQVSRGGGRGPGWSGDGTTLIYSLPSSADSRAVKITREPTLAIGQPGPAPLTSKQFEDLGLIGVVGVPHGQQPFLAIQKGEDEKPMERFDLVFNFFDVLNAKAPVPKR